MVGELLLGLIAGAEFKKPKARLFSIQKFLNPLPPIKLRYYKYAMHRQAFGGHWTERKLEAVQKYLNAYVTIMRNNRRASHFRLTYLDGFAGSGRRYGSAEFATSEMFLDFKDSDADAFYRGSPYRALEIEPPFDNYLFIESKREHVQELQNLVETFPDRAHSVRILQQDANVAIPDWCAKLARSDRALVFLDPYGMQVDWSTVQSLADTQKVDLWILVPLGQAIIRLLTAKQPPEDWARALTRFFGTDEWKNHFYPAKRIENLFGPEEQAVRDVDFQRITDYVVRRLGTAFSGVLNEPLLLRNSAGIPLYLLCFAASNPVGANTAVKIARDIAKNL